MAHSDVAAAPHQTNGLNFLKNVLMDVDGYIDVFSVVGGNEQIVTRLEEELDAEIRLNSNVTAVEPLAGGGYRLELLVNGSPRRRLRLCRRRAAAGLAVDHPLAVGRSRDRDGQAHRLLRPAGTLPSRELPVPASVLARRARGGLVDARRL